MRRRTALGLLLAMPVMARAQGFAGLGTGGEGFALPQRGRALVFPQDHGPHPDYRIEWWYLTASLRGADGTPYGLQWTLFRTALAPGETGDWSSPQVWMGHAAVTTPTEHFVAERLARGGTGQAGVTAVPFAAWIDDWSLAGDDFDRLAMRASGVGFGYEMRLEARGPLVLHGDAGYSVKSVSGQASYYYSQPYYFISGHLDLPSGPVDVEGEAWLDREWSSQPLAETQTGWDWFSLSFESGEKLMGFRLRDRDGGFYTAATWIAPGGQATAHEDGDFLAEPLETAEVAGRQVPVRWRVTLARRSVDVTVTALNRNAWMSTLVPYWEGPVLIEGSHRGRGYLEMTGYE